MCWPGGTNAGELSSLSAFSFSSCHVDSSLHFLEDLKLNAELPINWHNNQKDICCSEILVS